ncbi:MAG: hypothetical protein JXA52_08540 [Planctomycetes bacterium]|nr:hypothetical protein [Planctomycetota bacterium]
MKNNTFPFDFHLHTILSGHSQPDMLVGNIIWRADELGLEKIIILEHTPGFSAEMQASVIAGEYQEDETTRLPVDIIIHECASFLPQAKVRAIVGAEIDADPCARDGSLLMNDFNGIDIVMAATHYIPGARGIWNDAQEFPPEEQEKIYREWFTWAKAVAANPRVDILAHPGALLGNKTGITAFEGKVLKDFEELLVVCKENQVAFELNELLRRKLTESQAATYHNVIALARKVGVAISIGSDAHGLKFVGQYDWVLEIAKQAELQENELFMPAAFQ